jgi:hypothetical protein
MHPDERLYNYLHSKTRIAVEGAFGSLKNRFRIFKAPLSQKPKRAAQIVIFCLTLHNMLIHFKDNVNINAIPDDEENEEEEGEVNEIFFGDRAKLRRDNVKNYLLGL